MKLMQTNDDPSTGLVHRLVSQGGRVEIGIFRVLYGYRIRGGFVGDVGATVDWCAGDQSLWIEFCYRSLKTILESREENQHCFLGLPPCCNPKRLAGTMPISFASFRAWLRRPMPHATPNEFCLDQGAN